MELLQKYGVKTPKGGVAKTPEEAFQIAERLGNYLQWHRGSTQASEKLP
jgi:succinyl-CoA synthetase beta subunit